MKRAASWLCGVVSLLALTCEVDDSSDYDYASVSGGEAGSSQGGATSGGKSNGGSAGKGSGGTSSGGTNDGAGTSAGGAAEGGAPDSATGGVGVVSGSAGEPTNGGSSSGSGGSAQGGSPVGGGGAGGEPPSEGGTSGAGGDTTGSGGTSQGGASGSAGEGGAQPDACPSSPPGILTTFEDDLYTMCAPWDGFWAYRLGNMGGTATACPTGEFCSIFSGGSEGHGRGLAYSPDREAYEQYLQLDLRQQPGNQPFDASDYDALEFDAIAYDPVIYSLFVQVHTTETIEIEGGSGGFGEPGGACLEPGGDCAYPYEVESSVSGLGWETITIDFADFERYAPNNPVPFNSSQILYFRLYAYDDGTVPFQIDNVRFASLP